MKIFTFFVFVLTTLCSSSSFGNNINSEYPQTSDSIKPVEKVYLHTDRDSYYPGDDIWFKAYLIDASERLLTDNSNNLHVELITPASDIADSHIVRLDHGLGNGDFHLSEKIKSGRYRLRAYTNYMRNFGDQLFFNKDITIINPTDAAGMFTEGTDSIKNLLEIRFFPEGGSLVDNVSSVVAFKAVNASGNGCDVTGEVFSSTGELVTTIKSTHKGMGLFTLNPAPGLNYYTVIKTLYGDVAESEIPKSFKTGVAFNLSRNNDNQLVATFKTNKETLPQLRDQDLSLTVSSHNTPFKTINIRMRSLNSFLILPVDDLQDGTVMLTLSGPDSIPLCERLAYIQNSKEVEVKVETDRKVYNQRDSVSVKISLSENTGIPKEAFLSLSASKNISANNFFQYPSSISSWFLLESDVHGPVEEPSYYFDRSNPDRLKDLDLLLLTQGWRDFKWKYGFMMYPPEKGFSISGRLRKLFADVPFKKSSVNLAIFKDGNPLVKTLQADSAGRFYLNGVDLTGDAKLIVSGTGEKGRIQGWLLLDSLKYSPPKVQDNIARARVLLNDNQSVKEDQPASDNQLTRENLSAFLRYAEIKNSVKSKYKLSDTILPGEVIITAKRQDLPESARARNVRYLMTLMPDREYVITPESEIFNNLGQLIQFKLHFGAFGAGNMGGLAFNNPLILFEGMEVSWEDIEYLPVDWIERFDCLRPGSPAAAAWGERGKGGVISIISRTGASESDNLPAYHSANIKFSGYSEPRIFYSPKHYTKLESDYKPDLRTTLLWEPDIRLENKKALFLNFYNGDNPSIVRVTVEGITSTGIPLSGSTEYEVK